MTPALATLGPDADGPARAAYRRGAGTLVDGTQTIAWTWPMWPRAGLTRLADITGLDCLGIPVATAYRADVTPVGG